MKLLEPAKLGDIPLKNRMVMAPMTRSRANEHGIINDLTTVYYQQRASAGLIISEGLNISKQAVGLPSTPGIYTTEQIDSWKKVTSAVHQADGKIFAQLWHMGRAAHSHNKNGEIPVAPSAIPITVQTVFTELGREQFETPRELSIEEINQIIDDYKQAAINSLAAGFDGVELHGAFGYLPNQFLSESSNNRTDEFGGSIENRCRFTLNILKQLIAVAGPGKVGIKLSPSSTYHAILDNDPVSLYNYLFTELNKLDLAYVHIMQPMFPVDEHPQYPKNVLKEFGSIIKKPLIINAGYTRDTAEQVITSKNAQFVSFGALFLANPDLPERFNLNAPLNEPDRSTMYGDGDEKGYTDYPFLEKNNSYTQIFSNSKMKRIVFLLIAMLSFHMASARSVASVPNYKYTTLADTTLNHHFANVNGIKLHYVTCGSGPAVVLLHGWPFTWLEWRKVMILLAKSGYTAVAPDLRGMGDSEITETGYSKINVAEDIHQLVQQLGFKTIRMVAMDIGMMVAYPYAVEHQSEVTHLVLGESLIPGFGLEELMNPATGGYWHFGFHAQAGLAAMLTEGKEAAYLTPMYNLMSPDGHIDSATRAEYISKYSKPGAMKAGFQHYATILQDGKDNRANFKGKLTIPVLVLNGAKGIPSQQTFDCIRKVASNVQFGIVPNSGHALGEDNPVWYTNRMIQFFKN